MLSCLNAVLTISLQVDIQVGKRLALEYEDGWCCCLQTARSGYRPQCFRSAALVGGHSNVASPYLQTATRARGSWHEMQPQCDGAGIAKQKGRHATSPLFPIQLPGQKRAQFIPARPHAQQHAGFRIQGVDACKDDEAILRTHIRMNVVLRTLGAACCAQHFGIQVGAHFGLPKLRKNYQSKHKLRGHSCRVRKYGTPTTSWAKGKHSHVEKAHLQADDRPLNGAAIFQVSSLKPARDEVRLRIRMCVKHRFGFATEREMGWAKDSR
eukprot:1133646-Pelagomonas_calceolata.AAC.1